jgi:hypothetical protein
MEITKRFPQELGNLPGEREIPTFPQPIIFVSMRREGGKTKLRGQSRLTHKIPDTSE